MNFDSAACPFCGTEVADWDAPLCEHLIGDYGDGTDGDGGILCGDGGSRSGNKALEPLEGLHESLVMFVRVVMGDREVEGGITEVERSVITRALFPTGHEPNWLGPTLEKLVDGEEPDHRTVRTIWTDTVPWSQSLRETESTIGMMASTLVTFVWAQSPIEGAAAIKKALDRVIEDVRSTAERAATINWSA